MNIQFSIRPLTERATLKKVAAYERGMVTGSPEVECR